MDFTERMLERNRSRQNKPETKEGTSQTPTPLKEVHRNTVTTTISSTSVDFKKHQGTNKVTIETTVTMRKVPKMSPKPCKEEISSNDGEDSTVTMRKVPKMSPKPCKEEISSNDGEDSTGTECETDSISEKENVTTSTNCPLRQDTKKRLQRLGVLYSDHPSRLSSPIHRTEEQFLLQDEGKVEEPVPKSAKNSARSARLARLADTINQWEDDLKNPSVGSESQGFARSESSQRLIYNYNKERSPSPNKAESPRSKSPIKSYLFGESCSSPSKNTSPARTTSPTKSSPMRSISPTKGSSPLKAAFPLNVSSPVKDTMAKITTTTNSPIKGSRYGSPIQMGTSMIKVKEVVVPSSSDEDSSAPTMGVKQLRSPRKATPTASPAQGSVLDRAQRYEQATSPTKRARDPAELPLAERLALFERNAGTAVLPKAPFAMPVPASKLKTSGKAFITADIHKNQTYSKSSSQLSSGSSTNSLQDRLTIFEKSSDSSEKEHMKKILSEREKEMEMLRHRWDKYQEDTNNTHKEGYEPSAPPPTPPLVPAAPPLPSPPSQFDLSSNRRSGYYSEEEEEEYEEEPQTKPEMYYPVLKEVKKIKLSPPKPGCIYPCLSDIEAESEPQESEADECVNNRSSSSEISNESDLQSLGQDIVRISRSNLKRDWLVSEGLAVEENNPNEIDDFLDEALEDSSDEPTPPKRSSYSHNIGSVQSTSFEYSQSEGYRAEPDQPLQHTVSFYRRQQNMTLRPPSPSKQYHINPSSYSTDDSIERMEEELDRELKMVEEKIDMLQQEVRKQQIIISQASQALNLCYSTIEFSGSTEQLEAEKLLLLASQRRQAAQHEIQRLRVEQTVRPQTPGNKALTERGSLILSNITVPLKMDVIHQAAKDDQCYYLVCLVHTDERVYCTDIMCAPRSLHHHNKLTFPNTFTLDGLYSDFKVTLEVYTMTARSKELIPHDVKYHINTNKKEASKLKLTPRKGKGDSKLQVPCVQSPGGPSAVRTSSFTMAGYVIFSLREIQRKQFSLNKNAYTSVLEGSMHLHIESEMSMDVEYRGFLTMFEDVSGFGAWHRRWCLLKGDKLSYWKYPDDERKKIALDTIELTSCTTKEVDAVSRDVCARPNTFLLETSRPARPTDVDSLVLIRNGNTTTIRHLLSADTKEERILWCQHLNKALALMRAWGVAATK